MELERFQRNGTIYFKLFAICPKWIEQGKHSPPQEVIHSECGGHLFIGDNAHLLCQKCSCHEHIKHWNYETPSDAKTSLEFMVNSSEMMDLSSQVTLGGQLVKYTGQAWLIQYLDNLGEF